MGADYSIAEFSLLGWVRNLIGLYEARELVGFDRFLHVQARLGRLNLQEWLRHSRKRSLIRPSQTAATKGGKKQ